MERLTNKRESDAQREEYERRLENIAAISENGPQ